jgi:kynureninase
VVNQNTAAQLDAADPLAHFRDRFVGAASDLVYFDGNSLGRPLRVTGPRLAEFVEAEWGGRLIRGWDERWFDLPLALGDELGRVCLGAAPGQVAVGDSTTVLLYKLMRTAIAARPGRTEIVIDRDNFPTDRYLAAGVAQECGLTLRWLDVDTAAGATVDQVAVAVEAGETCGRCPPDAVGADRADEEHRARHDERHQHGDRCVVEQIEVIHQQHEAAVTGHLA